MSPDAVALKLVPVIVTEFPPAVGPLVGLIDVIAAEPRGVRVRRARYDVPPVVVTVTSHRGSPWPRRSAVTVSEVAEAARHRRRRRAELDRVLRRRVEKLVPVMVTVLVATPAVGDSDVTVAGANTLIEADAILLRTRAYTVWEPTVRPAGMVRASLVVPPLAGTVPIPSCAPAQGGVWVSGPSR